MTRQNKMARKLRVAREHSDTRTAIRAERKALAEKKRREEEARLTALNAAVQ